MADAATAHALQAGFLRSAARFPDRPALTIRDRSWTYAELEHRAKAWAQTLVRELGRPASRVGILAYRSEASYAGVLAALFSGAAFVPLNPHFPPKRTTEMMRRADLDALIVDRASARSLDELARAHPLPSVVLLPPGSDPGAVDGAVVARMVADSGAGATVVHPPPRPEDIAYLLFTSGSTGIPKGVPVTHANVCHFLEVVAKRYAFTEHDRFSQTFEQTFDLSIFDLFAAWGSGACVCVPDAIELLAPQGYVRRHEITVWFSVPSVVALMRRKNLLKPDSFPSLRWSLFCGEPLPRASAEAWQDAAPNSTVENLYGPTELTIACFVHRWHPHISPSLCVNDIVAIGRPFQGLEARILEDRASEDAGDGTSGELCVSGPQTVAGYWRDRVRTAERFITLGSDTERRFYRTGDRVTRLPNGHYAYLGRLDDQIKVLGHRVELGEIEAVLRQDPSVVEAAALGWPEEAGCPQGIVAFVSGQNLDVARLMQAAKASLPKYMLPRRIVTLDALPLNTNGKLDRDAIRRRLRARPAMGP